jgi:acetolactate synthase-1/2/3 large subunit
MAGHVGMHGTYEANLAMHDCDLMICLGARFDDRVTGRIDGFSPGSKKIHLDIDPRRSTRMCGSICPSWPMRQGAEGDAAFLEDAEAQGGCAGACRMVEADRLARKEDSLAYKTQPTSSSRNMPSTGSMRLTRGRDVYITTEVGQHQMWAAQRFKFESPIAG